MRDDPTTGAPPTTSFRTDLVTTLLATWFTLGLLLDSWAHNNLPGLESFLTPWHGVFYSGFTATALWVLWTVRRSLPLGLGALRAMPRAYAPTVLALPAFAVFGAGDWLWHSIFGIEEAWRILFSPTHLGLVTAMLVIVTTAARSAWADPVLHAGTRSLRLLPAVLSTALGTVLVLLFLQYANALVLDPATVALGLSGTDGTVTADVVTDVAATGAVLLLPLLVLARRWRLPLGAATAVYGTACLLSAAVAGFTNLGTVAGALLGGILVDVLARVLRPAPERTARWWAFGFCAPLLTWSAYLAGAYATVGTAPAPNLELLTGMPLVQALLGLLLAVLTAHLATPVPAAAPVPTRGGQPARV